jgi:hypothetical protein
MINEASMSKSLLAKLLATENITIRRDATASTASFDVKNRVLIMPVWKGVSEDLEDMLVVHEVGHALDTPCDGWQKAITYIANKYHTNPSRRHQMAVKGFLNVIEDARIDKRQKRRYPGSRRNYLAGYKELIERGFFGSPSRDFNTLSFIDRINVYFKGGVSLGIKFAPDEMPFVKRIENAETFADVLAISDDVYAFSKAKGEQKQETPTDIDDEEMEFGEDGEDFEGDFEEIESDDEGEDEGDGEGDSSDTEEDSDEGEGERGEKGEGDIEPEKPEAGQRSTENKEGSSGTTAEDDDFVPESETEKVWQEKQTELAGSDVTYRYLMIPTPNMAEIVDDYKVVLAQNEQYNTNNSDAVFRDAIAKEFAQFKSEENNAISFMVKEFEMRKSADMYAKISIAKTGVIDTNKLHSYKYNEDIFRRTATTPQGKNHGFIMFLDWSGSMSTELKSTMKQLLSMVLFCKRVQIPFEVYTFRDFNEYEAGGYYRKLEVTSEPSDEHFTQNDGEMKFAAFKMRNILSSRMSLAELNRAFNILWSLTTRQHSRMEPMGGTPLNAAIIAAEQLVNQFRARNKLQIVNTIFLTDGGSNPLLGVKNMSIDIYGAMRDRRKYFVLDEKTKKEYYVSDLRVDGEALTATLLKSLKDRTGCNLIGFYLYSAWGRARFQYVYGTFFGTANNQKHFDQMNKSWSDNKFIPVTSYGYDEYYVIDSKAMRETDNELNVNSNMSKNKVAKAFLTFASKKAVNRILLQRFITMTSTIKAA